MARFWIIIFALPLLVVLIYYSLRPSSTHLSIFNSPTPPTPTIIPPKTLYHNSQTLNYNLIKIVPIHKLKFISNLTTKLISSELMRINKCSAGVNGGFYTPAGESLGLLVINGRLVSPGITSSLLNGFLNFSDPPVISHSPPIDPDNALQNGPLLFLEGQPQLLNIKNDEPTRRIIALITEENQLDFIAIYDQKSNYSGPLLTDLPQILSLLGDQEKLNIKSALNLDGGSASAFYNDDIRLQELTTVGTFICIN